MIDILQKNEIICGKHGEMEGGSGFSEEVGGSHDVGVWKAIRNLWELVYYQIFFCGEQ